MFSGLMFKSPKYKTLLIATHLTGTLGGVILNGMMFVPSSVKICQFVKTVTWYCLCNKHQVKIQAF
jgi:hypothetical protein